MQPFYVFQIEVNEQAGDTWTQWLPIAVIEAETGARAIERLAENPEKVGDAEVYAAVPAGEIVTRMTTLHRHATVHEHEAGLTTLAPELAVEPEPAGVE